MALTLNPALRSWVTRDHAVLRGGEASERQIGRGVD